MLILLFYFCLRSILKSWENVFIVNLREKISWLADVFICITCKVDESTACTELFFCSGMTKELCWRVHIASLVEHTFAKRSELELLALDTFLSCHVLVIIFLCHVIYFTLFIIQFFLELAVVLVSMTLIFSGDLFYLCFLFSGKTASS